jgi:hypothetical protein
VTATAATVESELATLFARDLQVDHLRSFAAIASLITTRRSAGGR